MVGSSEDGNIRGTEETKGEGEHGQLGAVKRGIRGAKECKGEGEQGRWGAVKRGRITVEGEHRGEGEPKGGAAGAREGKKKEQGGRGAVALPCFVFNPYTCRPSSPHLKPNDPSLYVCEWGKGGVHVHCVQVRMYLCRARRVHNMYGCTYSSPFSVILSLFCVNL